MPLTLAVKSISSKSLVASTVISTLGVGARSMLMTLVSSLAAFITFYTCQLIHSYISIFTFTDIRANGVNTPGVCLAVVAVMGPHFATFINI